MALGIAFCIPYFYEPLLRWAIVSDEADTLHTLPNLSNNPNGSVPLREFRQIHLSKTFMVVSCLGLLLLRVTLPFLAIHFRDRREGFHGINNGRRGTWLLVD